MLYSHKLSSLLQTAEPSLPTIITVTDDCDEIELVNDLNLACSLYLYNYDKNKITESYELLVKYAVVRTGKSMAMEMSSVEDVGLLVVVGDITKDLERHVGFTSAKLLFIPRSNDVTDKQLSEIQDKTVEKVHTRRTEDTGSSTKSSRRSTGRRLWEL